MHHYECKYKDKLGVVKTEIIAAESAHSAMLEFNHSHSRCVLLSFPRLVQHHVPINRSRTVIHLVWCLAIIALILAGVLIISRGSSGVDDFSKPKHAIDEGKAYENVYSNLLRVTVGNCAGTGFKVRIDGRTYMYTCRHCLATVEPIQVSDCNGRSLELGDLEMSDRDLVRFELPREGGGLRLSDDKDVAQGRRITAYGNTQGCDVMTKNQGKILAVGETTIEIDAEVLQGNSGGPVVMSDDRVIGVVSYGFVDKGVYAKDTRYSKVRRFAVKISDCGWTYVDYEDYRLAYGTLSDIGLMIVELKQFIAELASVNMDAILTRPLTKQQQYQVDMTYSRDIDSLYAAYEKRRLLVMSIGEYSKKTDSLTGVAGLNKYKQSIEAMNALEKKYVYDIPIAMLKRALVALNQIQYPDMVETISKYVKDIEVVLIPAHETALADFRNRQLRLNEAYKQDVATHYRAIDEQEKSRKETERANNNGSKSWRSLRPTNVYVGNPGDWRQYEGSTIRGPMERPDPDSLSTRILGSCRILNLTEAGELLLQNNESYKIGSGVVFEVKNWRIGDEIAVASAHNVNGSQVGYWLINMRRNTMIFAKRPSRY